MFNTVYGKIRNLLNIRNIIIFLSFIFSVVSAFLSNNIVFVLCCFFVAGILVLTIVKKRFAIDALYFLVPMLLTIFIGSSVGLFTHFFDFKNYIKDIYYYGQELVFILFGILLASFSKNKEIKTGIIFSSFFLVIFNIIKLIVSLPINWATFRTILGNGQEQIFLGAIFLLGFYFENKKKSRSLIALMLSIFLFLYIFSTFSRSIIVLAIIISVFYAFSKLSFKKFLIFLLVFVSTIALTVLCTVFIKNDFIQEFYRKVFSVFEELSPNHDWANGPSSLKTYYWRGYENYCFLASVSSFNVFEILFGKGFGYCVPIGYPTNLGGQIFTELPVLHNTFASLLCKTGMIGFLFSLLFFTYLFYILLKYGGIKNNYFPASILIFEFFLSFVSISFFGASGQFALLITLGLFLPNKSKYKVSIYVVEKERFIELSI